jgi:hypothetical protein
MISEVTPGEGAGGSKSGKWTNGKLKPKKKKDPEPWHNGVMERLARLLAHTLTEDGFFTVCREAMKTLRSGNVLVVFTECWNNDGQTTRVHMWTAAGDISALTKKGTKENV